MIRDPSDGSVREVVKPTIEAPKPVVTPQQTENLARLERSRQWLRDYHASKNYPQKSEQNDVSGLPD